MSKIQRRYQWLAAGICLFLLMCYWHPVVTDPHLFLFGPGGDGVKNYFSPLFYILNDSNAHFTGMNYPFGEHIAYIDAQPWLSTILRPILNGNDAYAGNIVALMNLLMLGSIPVAAVYLSRLFALWQMPHYYSVAAAVCIALLSPQVFRMTGHYALAYTCFVPMIWYYAAAWLEERRWQKAFFLFLTLLLFGGLHAYYFALAASFLLPLAVFYWLKLRCSRKAFQSALVLFTLTLAPMVVYSIWLQTSGAYEYTDRHPRPYGFFYYTSSFQSIFLPHQGIVYEWLSKLLPLKACEFEGIAYVGTAPVIAFIGALWLRYVKNKGEESSPSPAVLYLIASLPGLFIAMSFPFNFIPGSWIPEPVWQFRALGRFSWTFYYVFGGTAAWLLYQWAESLRKRSHAVMAMGIVVVLLLLWISEGLSAQKKTAGFVKEHGKVANDFLSHDRTFSQLLSEAGKRPETFQALLVFPYFHIGSEEIYIERSGASLYEGCKAALELHLPLAQTFLGRTAINQTLQLVQLMSHDAIPKDIISELQDPRPFLLLVNGSDISEREQQLIGQAKLLGQFENIKMYELPLSAFQNQRRRYQKQLENARHDKMLYKSIILGDTIWSWPGSYHYWQAHIPEDDGKKSSTLLFESEHLHHGQYEASLWLRTELRRAAFPVLYVRQFSSTGQLIEEAFHNPKTSIDVYQGHVRTHVVFQVAASATRCIISLEGRDEKNGHSFLLKDSGVIYTAAQDGRWMMDNYPIRD
jgi:hypothetical protein